VPPPDDEEGIVPSENGDQEADEEAAHNDLDLSKRNSIVRLRGASSWLVDESAERALES